MTRPGQPIIKVIPRPEHLRSATGLLATWIPTHSEARTTATVGEN
jgi:hypothetical protein